MKMVQAEECTMWTNLCSKNLVGSQDTKPVSSGIKSAIACEGRRVESAGKYVFVNQIEFGKVNGFLQLFCRSRTV